MSFHTLKCVFEAQDNRVLKHTFLWLSWYYREKCGHFRILEKWLQIRSTLSQISAFSSPFWSLVHFSGRAPCTLPQEDDSNVWISSTSHTSTFLLYPQTTLSLVCRHLQIPLKGIAHNKQKSLHNFMCYRGLSLSIRQNQIKGGISRLAKSRKPQFTAVNEDLRDKRNAEITLLSILKGQLPHPPHRQQYIPP